jgi:tripartite-type tricarboxylate transporter receptor subunit TctC
MKPLNHFLEACLALALVAAWGAAQGQAFPVKPIRIVIPFAPGGGTDNLVRIIAPYVGDSLGQTLVIENRSGAATVIGTEAVVRSAPDGYTLLASDSTLLINPGLLKKRLPFDTIASLTGVTMLASAPVFLLIHPSVPAKSLEELLALAKSKPGSLSYASGGVGASTHLAGELLKLRAGVDIAHIPYKGSAPALADMLSGQVQMGFSGGSTAGEYIKSGRLRAIAITGKERSAAFPGIPTFDEAGLTGIDADTYWGIYAPAGTPAETVATINKHVANALRHASVAPRVAALGYRVIANTPQEHTAQMRTAIMHWTEVVDKAGISPD